MKSLRNFAALMTRRLFSPSILGTALFCIGTAAQAVNFPGNGDAGFGGPIGEGTLSVTNDGTNIYGTLNFGGNGSLNGNDLVIYIDTGAGGGFNTTSNFDDQGDGNRIPISGISGSTRSTLNFETGFAPQYAISLVPTVYGGIWKLAVGGNNSFTYIDSVNFNPDSNTGPDSFYFPVSDLGLTPGATNTIKLLGTLISGTAYRSTEAIAGNVSSGQGQGYVTFTQTAFASYTVGGAASTSVPLTFKVDMTAQIANGVFNPGNGDTVYAAGTFQTTPFSGFLLTNNPASANTNIYSGTYLSSDPTNTAEQYHFFEVSASSGTTNNEVTDNRVFTQTASAQTLPLVYFADLSPTPSATTNSVTFHIDMTGAIALGLFNPSTETIQALGTFEVPAYTAGFILTNNPAASNANIYSGTYADGNYPGSYEQYKYVIVNGTALTYESTANRDFYTPTNAGTLPLAYFNNQSNVITVPVTFQVNVTAELESGVLTPTNGDTVGIIGSFQNPAYSGAVLTNTPGNSNIYTGTFLVSGQPGTTIQYKFTINNSTGTTYEQPASTGGNNRQFVLGSSAQTLPVVFFSDQDPNNVLPQSTYVTFTVNMTNAIDEYSNAFVPATDDVFISGTFTTPPFELNWTDTFIDQDYPQFILTNNPPSLLYSQTYLVPAGSSLQVTYKYGIYHNVGSGNTNADNEAGFANNHSRYIRALGNYAFPVDIFGSQRTNAAAANEISFGNLAINKVSSTNLSITFLGRPGVFLQSTTNLANPVWTTLTNSGGIMATNISPAGKNVFYRLVNP